MCIFLIYLTLDNQYHIVIKLSFIQTEDGFDCLEIKHSDTEIQIRKYSNYLFIYICPTVDTNDELFRYIANDVLRSVVICGGNDCDGNDNF